ncbi:DnaJ domain-containing protein [Dechloromonas hortensis]|uniref:DnaJ domain-containing protein n=1 Tax=Dechloromonas hortensis TaxID=337779 RepID=UPI0014794B52|nr:DnaJ domain-containing protein [Dechloromonas hortensis]
MANTLYDLLEVSQSASADAIAAGYKRLHAQYAESAAKGDEDATNRMIALREAFTTLSEPSRRQRYDDSLAARDQEVEAEPAGRPFVKLIVIACIVGFFGITYKKYQTAQETARLEAERVVAAAKTAETDARLAEAEARKAAEERIAAERADRQRQRDEAMERANRERDIAYGNQVSRNLERAEADARRAAEREEQAKANAERQKEYEAERALAREKAYLRQVEAEKNRYRY